ncbi:MAG TPA: ABC transporter permease [Thermomicrobiaceae bacterium]|nr:ABC transporter permease [Thermomicrobiaceae bacterium]
MSTFGVLLGKDLTEQWRTRRLLIVVIIFLLLGLSSPLLAYYTPQLVAHTAGDLQLSVPTPTTADAVDQLLKNLTQIGPFAAILLAMGTVARELERGTAAFILSKPVSRDAFLASKFLALALLLALAVLVAAIGAYFYTAVIFSRLPLAGFAAANLLALLLLLAFAAFTFLGSALLGSALPAAGLGFALWVLSGIVGVVPHAGRFTPLGLGDPARGLALGQPAAHLGASLAATLALIALTLAATWLVFRRKEIES